MSKFGRNPNTNEGKTNGKKTEKLVACPYFIDEGMSVYKSKAKCLAYFAKKGSGINMGLEDALKKHEEKNAEIPLFLEGLEDALKNQSGASAEDIQVETVAETHESAIEKYKKKK